MSASGAAGPLPAPLVAPVLFVSPPAFSGALVALGALVVTGIGGVSATNNVQIQSFHFFKLKFHGS